MQAQYGPNPKKMREIVSEMYNKYGWRKGIMRGFWVRCAIPTDLEETSVVVLADLQWTSLFVSDYGGEGDSGLRWILRWLRVHKEERTETIGSEGPARLGNVERWCDRRNQLLDCLVSGVAAQGQSSSH